MQLRLCATAVATLVVLTNTGALAEKYPNCVDNDAQVQTKIAVKRWVSSLMDDACATGPCRSRLLDVQISTPHAEDAYPGPYAGVVKCSVGVVAIMQNGDRLPLPRVMIYYTYDQNGRLIVEAMPKSNRF